MQGGCQLRRLRTATTSSVVGRGGDYFGHGESDVHGGDDQGDYDDGASCSQLLQVFLKEDADGCSPLADAVALRPFLLFVLPLPKQHPGSRGTRS